MRPTQFNTTLVKLLRAMSSIIVINQDEFIHNTPLFFIMTLEKILCSQATMPIYTNFEEMKSLVTKVEFIF